VDFRRLATNQYTSVFSLQRFNLKCRKTVKWAPKEGCYLANYVVQLPQETPLDAESEGVGL
jgi:hypothetical protein